MPTQTIIKKITGKPIPVLKSRVSTRQFRLSKDGAEESSTSDLQQWLKRKQSIWQADQNPFSDKEQLEEIQVILVANNPQLPDNLVEFSFKDKTFITVLQCDQNIILLDVEGTSLHIDSQEAKDQIEGLCSGGKIEEAVNEEPLELEIESVKEPEEEEPGDEEIDDEESKDIKEEKEDDLPPESTGKTKKLMNQFNFCERATITYDNAVKDIGTQTKPPTRAKFSDYATQWIIYDTYQEDYENQEKEKDRGKKEKPVTLSARKEDYRRKSITEKNDILNANIAKKGSILERMINQNMFDDILQDFRYYEDPSDEFRNNEGTLLPLWKFQFNDTKKLCVTDIKWNPRHFDLFAVSFGTFDFQKKSTKGYFCLWSLKNPSYPEYITHTQSGIMTLDFHHSRPYLVVVGLNDGIVAVYDARLATKSPIYQSSHVNNKHYGIVWQVLWGEDLAEGELMFYSVSSDGNVYSWILIQNQLSQTLVICLSTVSDTIYPSDNEQRPFKGVTGSGTCIALHPTDSSIFLIGTEEGYIYKCSTAYLSMYLFVYEAHHMPIHRLDYNKYSSDIFVSCSADWSIKIWEDNRKEPLFVFDTASAVGDVKWSPYSSTVLAAVSLDCKAYVFDLNIDKYKAICVQTIASKKLHKLTRLSFNWKLPILIVGDDKGICQVLKLSPNLRIKPKITKKQQGIDPRELELMKLEKLLSLIREPTELSKTNYVQSSETSSL